MSITSSQLARLTAAKAAANTSLRWVPFFLPTLTIAFGASTATLAGIVGFGEMAGLTTLLMARHINGGNARLVVAFSLMVCSIACLIALHGSLPAFAISFLIVVAAVGHVTVGGHTWISSRVSFCRRARYIGIFEISWAMALLVGAPSLALLIDRFGWRGPYIALAILCAALSVIILTMADSDAVQEPPAAPGQRASLTADAWRAILASAAIAMAGLTMIVVLGTWLADSLAISTGGVGLVAMAFGLAELTASSSSASFADRLGKRRTTVAALAVMLIGLVIVPTAGSSRPVAIIGLVFLFLGFEYAIVTSFSLVSESMPTARGRALATSNAVGTVARGLGAGAAGLLYGAFGISGPALVSGVAAAVALLLLVRGSTTAALLS